MKLTPDTPKKKRAPKPQNQRLSVALKRVCERALRVPEEELRSYAPREIDVRICEALLSGAMTFIAVAEMIEVSPQTVSLVLRDPAPCAWIARQIRENIQSRLGLVDAAMLGRALSGNVEAAKLIYARHDGLQTGPVNNIQINQHFDYSKLSDEQLNEMISQETAKHADLAKDVEAEVEDA